jgi:hypothetical protein
MQISYANLPIVFNAPDSRHASFLQLNLRKYFENTSRPTDLSRSLSSSSFTFIIHHFRISPNKIRIFIPTLSAGRLQFVFYFLPQANNFIHSYATSASNIIYIIISRFLLHLYSAFFFTFFVPILFSHF